MTFDLIPYYQFPDPHEADDDGFLAYGGNLSYQMLLSAYMQGVFPWYDDSQPILWWSPDPRFVLLPEEFRVPKSLKKRIEKGDFNVRFDQNFSEVIKQCSIAKRKGQRGTWITSEMIAAYTKLHQLGFAHSVETYQNNLLVGGLYGLSLGRIFCGESMFHTVSDASKVAFYFLVNHLIKRNFRMIDAQVPTDHLKQFGAKEMSRNEFLDELKKNISLKNHW